MTRPQVPWPVALVGLGWLGRALARQLASESAARDPDALRGVSRSGRWQGEDSPPPSLELHAFDALRDPPPKLAAILQGVRTLVVGWSPRAHAFAGSPGEPTADTFERQDRRALYVEGLARLFAATRSLELARVVYLSSTSALPEVDAWLDESCEAWPVSERGRVQREAENLVRETCEARNWPWIVLRLGGLYGPGRELERMYMAPARGSGPRSPRRPHADADGRRPTNLVHLDDALRAVQAAMAAPEHQRGLVHVVDDDHCTRFELHARLAENAGRPAPSFPGSSPRSAAVGKRVCNRKLKTWLRVGLNHPLHLPEADL